MVTVIPSVRPTWTDLARCGLAIMMAASVANTLLLTPVLGTGLVESFAPPSYPPVAFLSVADMVTATLVYGSLTDRVIDVDQMFSRVAAAVLMASFLLDIGLLYVGPGAIVPGVLVSMLIHVIIAAVCVASLAELGWGAPKGTDRAGSKSDHVTAV